MLDWHSGALYNCRAETSGRRQPEGLGPPGRKGRLIVSGVKKWFENPKKAALVLGCAGVMLVTLGVCIAVYAAGGPGKPSAIGGERAQSFAFADAGVDPVEAREVEVKYGRFQEGFVYEVEFTAGNTEYEYKIDAEDGSVVKKESKEVKGAGPAPLTALTLEEARDIALVDAGVERGQAVFTEAEADTENGVPVYEFKFSVGDTEYTYEINGHTGAVYSKGVVTYMGREPAPSAPPAGTAAPQPTQPAGQPPAASAAPQPQQTGGQEYIGLDAAKRAALADAGADGAQAWFTKAELDYDDGVPVYELEFYTAAHEYEYEIHAVTGAVYSRGVEAFPGPGEHHSGPDPAKDGYIGTERARQAALDHAGCPADQAVFTKTELDYDDGRAVYEVEFRRDGTEYEYEIDAATGEVLHCEWERH